MQTLRKPARPEQKEAQRQQRRIGAAPGLLNVIACLVVFGIFAWFVNSLEGLDGDTLFIALFCTALTMFIFKAIASAVSARRSADEQ